MRIELITLIMFTPALAHAQDLARTIDREAAILRVEREALENTLEQTRRNAEVANDALAKEIESLTAELVRLRAENAARERALPVRERLANSEQQTRQLEALSARLEAWLSARGKHSGGFAEAFDLVLRRGGLLRVEDERVFERSGEAKRESIVRVGRVAALGDGAALLPVNDGYRVLDVGGAERATADGVARSAVVFDPENPQFESRETGPGDWLRAGGPLLWPILALAVLALAVTLERSARLALIYRSWRVWRDDLRRREAEHDWKGAAEAALDTRPRWLAKPFVEILTQRNESLAKVEERATEALLKLRPHLTRRMSVLGVTAAVAPLLGLLGTVTGMITTFSAITTHGTGDPRLLSDGISEALVTTQLGLAVAIPALLLHTGLQRWAASLFSKIEDACLALLHHLEDLDLTKESAVHHDLSVAHTERHHG
ncbi:MAG: MotA/TolQ/ExbB proton channel family protein [Myxococcota bacterium]